MATKIVPHAEDKKSLVEDFNGTLKAAGSPWGFYVEPEPRWIPKRPGQKVWRELHLAIENGERCVGAYGLKPQEWVIHGETQTIADWQGPVSLGAVDNRYAVLGLRLIRDMLKKWSMLYSWGHGGDAEPIVQLLQKMGWMMHQTPFLFRVCRPKNFLQKNGQLRKDPKKALAQDVLAMTGLGSIGMHAMHRALRVKSLKRYSSAATVVPEFGPWADQLWEAAKGRYDAIAVRDADTMNLMVPRQHTTLEWPEPIRLRVVKGERTLGWAVVLHREQSGDPRFGDMHIGMVADYLALPEDAGEVVHAAYHHLRKVGVDMVIANQSHAGWISAFVDNGFVAVEDRRIFCASPEFQKALEPWEQTKRGLFLSNYDGHGPIM